MLVIIEGADGAGKTTLANRLRQDLKQHHWLIRSNGPIENVWDMVKAVDWLTHQAPPRTNIIFDRFPLFSEWVYGPILRDKCAHDYSPELMARYLITGPNPALVLYCRPRNDEVRAMVNTDEHRAGVREKIGPILTAYDNLMFGLHREGLRILKLTWEDPYEFVLDTVQDFFDGELTDVGLSKGQIEEILRGR